MEGCLLRQALPDLGSERVQLTGEAAGLMYLNGEGISAAMVAAHRAGKAVSRAIRKGGNAAEQYMNGSADILAHMDKCMQQLHFLTSPGNMG